jgi:hypothetical protein
VHTAPTRERGLHLVDDLGLVGCSRSGTDVPVATCLRCRERRGTMTDDTGRVRAIRCVGDTDASSACWPWRLGWLAWTGHG